MLGHQNTIADVNAVATCQFGGIHRLIRSPQHSVPGITWPGKHGDPEARSYANFDVATVEPRTPKLVHKALGKVRGPFEVRLGREDVELFAADPAEQIDWTHASSRDLGEADQNGIACVVSVLVIDPFEMVEIDGNKSTRLVIADRTRNLPIKFRSKDPAVRETG